MPVRFTPKRPKLSPEERIAALQAENTLLRTQVSALSDQAEFHEELIVELANEIYS